jgi:hypothetical protein
MKQKNIHLLQLLVIIVVSFILAFIEFKLNVNSFWVMLVFFGLSLFAGSKIEGYFKMKLFEKAVQNFINSLREIRINYNLKPIVTQSLMRQVTKHLIEIVNVNPTASQEEKESAGSHLCKTCNDSTPHVTDEAGKCKNCQIGLKFWRNMEANSSNQ